MECTGQLFVQSLWSLQCVLAFVFIDFIDAKTKGVSTNAMYWVVGWLTAVISANFMLTCVTIDGIRFFVYILSLKFILSLFTKVLHANKHNNSFNQPNFGLRIMSFAHTPWFTTIIYSSSVEIIDAEKTTISRWFYQNNHK